MPWLEILIVFIAFMLIVVAGRRVAKRAAESDNDDAAEESVSGRETHMETVCTNCGSELDVRGHCRECGYSTEENEEGADEAEEKRVAEQPKLIPCPDCGNEVSLYATSCPKCGRPLNPVKMEEAEPRRKGTNGVVVFIAVVLGILVAIWIASKIFHVELTGTITPMK